MGGSPGFGSCNNNNKRRLRLAFALAPLLPQLNLLLPQTRWLILQKARRHPIKGLRLLVSTRFQVLFHSPARGTFHLSLTVLVHYR